MLDIKLIREKPDFVRQRLATRGAGDEAKIDEFLQADEQRRKFLAEVEALKAQRNRVSKEIGALMGQKKIAEAEAKKAETRDLGDKIAALDKQAAESETARDELMLQLPNLPHESVAVGKIGGRQSGHSRFWREGELSPSSRSRTSSFASRSSWWISRARRNCPAADFCSTRIGARGWSGR